MKIIFILVSMIIIQDIKKKYIINVVKTNCNKSFGLRSTLNKAVELCRSLSINIYQYNKFCSFEKSLVKLL